MRQRSPRLTELLRNSPEAVTGRSSLAPAQDRGTASFEPAGLGTGLSSYPRPS